jgi:LysR family transcriptional regulator, regulator of the ytmI operon
MGSFLEIRHLQTYQSIVKHGSFLAAAGQLGCAQSTVSLHIQQLEASLGAPLFERGTRRLLLTEAGRTLQEQSGHILGRVNAIHETIAEMTAGESGHLRIGTIEPIASLRLPPLLVRFCRERPNVRLSIEIGGTDSVSRGVAACTLDFGVCSPPPLALGLCFEPIHREELVLLVPEVHPLADRTSVDLVELTGHRLLLTEPACAYRELTERALRDRAPAHPAL